MNFSDWIVIVSILLAVFLAVFKFDEWELIRLKHYEKFIALPIFFLVLCGISSYFDKNTPPSFINFLWSECGLPSGVWAIIWMIMFVCSIIYFWKQFTNQKPSGELVKKYIDYIGTYDPAKFSSLFRKYEGYFFNSNDSSAWLYYETILISKEWWNIAPAHFKEILFKNPNRFYELDTDVLISLLVSQFSSLPKSQIAKELELTGRTGIILSEDTPVLNIFLSNPEHIEKNRERNILLPTIKEISEEYFASNDFLKRDKENLILKPSNNSFRQNIPYCLIPFYYIQFINCYWRQVFKTEAQVSGFFFYLTWTHNLLSAAPEIENNLTNTQPQNLFVKAVELMLSNFNDWIEHLERNNMTDFIWAATHFIEHKQWILTDIQDKFSNKVPEEWFIEQCEYLLKEMIICREKLNDSFSPRFINNNIFATASVQKAFENLTDSDYFSNSEQENEDYQWLKTFIENSNAALN